MLLTKTGRLAGAAVWKGWAIGHRHTMHDEDLGRAPVQLIRGRGAPLPYQSNGKHTESVEAGAEKVEAGWERQPSELKTMRKTLSVIGDPLPLDYLRNGGDQVAERGEKPVEREVENEEEAVQRPAAQGRKPRALRLADLGQPLPLKYNPAFNESWRAEQRLLTQAQAPAPTQQHSTRRAKQTSAAGVYDFGTPLPLPYADDDAIETEQYLRWKSSAAPGAFDEWKTQQDGRSRDTSRIPSGAADEGDLSQPPRSANVTSSIEDAEAQPEERIRDAAIPEPMLGAEHEQRRQQQQEQEQAPEQAPEPEPEPAPAPEMAVDHEIQRYILHDDYRGLEEKLGDAEFRLRLLRYTRNLKRQYDALCRVLHAPAVDDDVDNGPYSDTAGPGFLSAPRRAVVLQSAALSTGAFVLLCTISYFLAD
ncbi:hypothetical protein PICMEDRAFT_150499 [Pichia membranifaciens NRRL Y-2026]|uniref:Uncharacterized protein n=1 Tax=Pichia membranifaciens NRRL Y-2026 TaxID=763406 RepID=A0A1E3NIQ5_9ASCO|nr:hypothetical protein PICMEDRAFT_150499 [Pichia membranifaciens NRRL Y-2026]ODQ46015.1 hypothetical protein PICMEDRAFT_150499 [Pichia membranifaciens NRRL Y-2026]